MKFFSKTKRGVESVSELLLAINRIRDSLTTVRKVVLNLLTISVIEAERDGIRLLARVSGNARRRYEVDGSLHPK